MIGCSSIDSSQALLSIFHLHMNFSNILYLHHNNGQFKQNEHIKEWYLTRFWV